MSLLPFDYTPVNETWARGLHAALERLKEDMRCFEREFFAEVEAMKSHGSPTIVRTGSRDGLMTRETVDDYGNKKLNMHFDVRQYRPEEIRIVADGKMVRVDAKHEEMTESGMIHKEFHRAFTVPRNVDMSKLKSTLDQGGVLTIEAPIITGAEIPNKTVIPIQHK